MINLPVAELVDAPLITGLHGSLPRQGCMFESCPGDLHG